MENINNTRNLYDIIKQMILVEDLSEEDVRNTLFNRGLIESENEADELISLCIAGKKALKSANRTILMGSIFAIGGAVVTVVTYTAAANGGSYVVAWGAILYGIIDIIRGFASKNKALKILDNPFI